MPVPKRPPAFQFYPDAWLASIAVTTMPAEVEGTYIRLLCYQWQAITLPADPAQLRALTKLNVAQWKRAWPMLEPHFPLEDGGRRNPTLHALHVEREAFIETQRTNGRKGGRPRTQPNGKPPANPTETQQKPNGYVSPNPNESSVSGSVSGSVTPPLPDGSVPLKPPPVNPPPDATSHALRPTPDPGQLADLRNAALPHEQAALDLLLQQHPQPFALVAELHAIASGLHVHRGHHTGRQADAADVMRAVSEYAASGERWNVSYFRGFVRRIADHKPEPPSTEERNAKRLEREIAARAAPAGIVIEQPRTPEELEETRQRVADAMAKFRALASQRQEGAA